MTTQRDNRTRLVLCLSVAALLLTTFHPPALAQYVQFNLVSTDGKLAIHGDPHLINGWGLAFFPTSPFWVADNGTGVATIYDHSGTAIPLVVTVPTAASQPFGPIGTPTGIVTNATPGFVLSLSFVSAPALFLFATLDGTISGWNPKISLTNALRVVDNSASSAIYTGLAFATNSSGAFLYAADAFNNKIDMFDSNFKLVKSFTDPNTPVGLSVYGIQNVHGRLYVTLATPVPLQGGAIDVFDTNGNLLRRLTTNGPEGPMQAPWGIALAPGNFGPLSNALLIGDVDDGHINAFDPKTGAFLGMMTRPNGHLVTIGGLWALHFGAGNPNNGNKNELFFTAGPAGYRKGLFGLIQAQGTN